MNRLLVMLLITAACRRSEPQPREHVAPPVAAADAGARAGSAAPAAAPRYRTEASGNHVDPAVAGVGKTSMVASEDVFASKAGEAILAAGGNAVDGAIATAFVLAVTHPSAGNLAGGGFAVVRTAKGKATTLDFRETAPAAATANMFLDAGGNPTRESLSGDKACGVPGSVAGLWALHQKYGKTKWADLIAPAIALAKHGFAVPEMLHDSLVRVGKFRGPTVTGAPLWWPNGKPRDTGEVVTNPELATVLERIAASGPDGFYKGETAAAIVAEMKRGGGLITAADLVGYKAIWRDPLVVSYRGNTLYAMPPPSSGGIVVAITANLLRKQELAKLGWHSEAHVHWLVEMWRRAFAARNEILGDPAYVKDMPIAKLVSPEYADQLGATITDKATPSKNIPGLLEGTHTTNLSVVDGSDMAVALTTTLNTSFGNAVMVSGFLLNNEMDDFTAKPGSPNVYGLVQGSANKIEPGKRMLSSMSPTILEDDKGEVRMVVGGGGGPRIITEVWQALSNVVDFGMPVDAAIAAPRVHHQHLPDDVVLEDEAITKAVGVEKDRADGLDKALAATKKDKADADKQLEALSTKAADVDKRAAKLAEEEKKVQGAIDKSSGSVDTEGDEIHLKLIDKVLFAVGDDQLTTQGKAVLDKVAVALKDLPDKQVWVQGHTDDQPIFIAPPKKDPKTPKPAKGAKPAPPAPNPIRFVTNWELSAARALQVVHYLQDVSKIDPTRLAALAFGQYRPVSRTNKAANRRIEIVLYPKREILVKDTKK